MRISDWSSDVCSSDLNGSGFRSFKAEGASAGRRRIASKCRQRGGVSVVRRTRWAISFADLCLLLLGFFVLLQANSQDARNVMTHVSQYFGDKPQAGRIDFLAADLFEPGEERLTARGRRLLLRIGNKASEKKGKDRKSTRLNSSH